MSELITRILNFIGQFKLLVIILPWERAVRIRLGNRVAVWEPGWHIKLPFLDEIVPVNNRLRLGDTGAQTLTTVDGKTFTVGMTLGFRIADPLTALMRMQSPENSCSAIAASVVAALVSSSQSCDLSVESIEAHVLEKLRKETPYELEFVRVRDLAYARVIRLLHDNGYQRTAIIEERKL